MKISRIKTLFLLCVTCLCVTGVSIPCHAQTADPARERTPPVFEDSSDDPAVQELLEAYFDAFFNDAPELHEELYEEKSGAVFTAETIKDIQDSVQCFAPPLVVHSIQEFEDDADPAIRTVVARFTLTILPGFDVRYYAVGDNAVRGVFRLVQTEDGWKIRDISVRTEADLRLNQELIRSCMAEDQVSEADYGGMWISPDMKFMIWVARDEKFSRIGGLEHVVLRKTDRSLTDLRRALREWNNQTDGRKIAERLAGAQIVAERNAIRVTAKTREDVAKIREYIRQNCDPDFFYVAPPAAV